MEMKNSTQSDFWERGRKWPAPGRKNPSNPLVHACTTRSRQSTPCARDPAGDCGGVGMVVVARNQTKYQTKYHQVMAELGNAAIQRLLRLRLSRPPMM